METNNRAPLIPASLQKCIAILLVAFVLGLAWIPAACFTPPQLPTVPTVPTFQLPSAPSVDVPTVEAPQAPTPPDTPALPGGGGHCCLRGGPAVGEKCGGAATCCTPDFKNSSDCEDAKGFWFFSKEGCAGAC
jgi:hypothetical protein